MAALSLLRLPEPNLEPRHICIVTETFPPEINGVAVTLDYLVRGLKERGHVTSLVRPRQGRIDNPRSGAGPNLTLVRGLPLPGYAGLQFGLPAGRLLRQRWSIDRPDAIYVATEGPLGWSAITAAKRLVIPVVSGFHTNYHSYSRYYGVGRLQELIFRYLRSFHNKTQATLVSSVDLRERLQSRGFANISVLERGVDTGLFSPTRRSTELRRQWGVTDSGIAVVCVGRLAKEKNLGLVIETYEAIKRENSSCRCIFVGDGPLRKSLQRRHPELVFSGMRTGEDLARHYASADLFVFPSETETFGNVILEAMASGLAVVAYDYAAARIHLKHGETGMVVPYADGRAFLNTALLLARQPLLVERIRRAAREHISAFSWNRVVQRFEALMAASATKTHDRNA